MCPNTKTFSDITAIDTKNRLFVQLHLVRHGYTHSRCTLNQVPINGDWFNFHVDLFDPICVEIDLLDFRPGSSGIEVGLIINQYEILPKYRHLATSSSNYIDKLGKWQFKVPKNFYLWHHNISGQGFIA
jgi:hypothetical protein